MSDALSGASRRTPIALVDDHGSARLILMAGATMKSPLSLYFVVYGVEVAGEDGELREVTVDAGVNMTGRCGWHRVKAAAAPSRGKRLPQSLTSENAPLSEGG
jgi:hypothetical protein